MGEDSVVFEAIKFAAEAHYGHYRKGSKVPYMAHLLSVARILASSGSPASWIAAGVLHDSLEDTPTTQEQLKLKFGEEITQLVIGASEDEKLNPERGKDYSWRERKENTLRYLQEKAGIAHLTIAIADKLDNIRSTRRDFEKMGDKVWDRFNAGVKQQKWYYLSLLQLFKGKAVDNSPLEDIVHDFEKEVLAVFEEERNK